MKAIFKFLCFILVLAGTALGTYKYNDYLNENVRLTEYTYSSEKLPKAFDGYKIIAISDIHNAPFSDQIIDIINREEPDIIVFTGDMVQLPDSEITESINIADAFKGKIPTYVISGNHESQNDAYWDIYDNFYYSSDVNWLEGYGNKIEKNGEKIFLAGIPDPQKDFLNYEDCEEIRDNIKESLNESDGCFTILLNHRADLYPEIKDLGIDLILSGHLHGGIIRLPILGGVCGRGGALSFPDYDYGEFKEGDSSTMIVNGGCDKNPEKKRWFNQPEVQLITLESE